MDTQTSNWTTAGHAQTASDEVCTADTHNTQHKEDGCSDGVGGQTAMAEFRTQVRYLDFEEQKPYRAKIEAYEARFTEQLNSLQFAERNEVTGGGVGAMSTTQMLDRADQIQQGDIAMVQNMIRTTETDKEIGVETLAQLDEQNEKLRAARGQVDQINSDLDIAKKTLRQIANRYATDKLILVLVVLIALGILVAIIVALTKKKK